MEYELKMGAAGPVDDGEGKVFFLCHNSSEAIPTPSSLEEADSELPRYMEFGLVDNTGILNLETSLMQVHIIIEIT